MKAQLFLDVICPGCDCVMSRIGDNTVACLTHSCPNYYVPFEAPSILLVRKIDIKHDHLQAPFDYICAICYKLVQGTEPEGGENNTS